MPTAISQAGVKAYECEKLFWRAARNSDDEGGIDCEATLLRDAGRARYSAEEETTERRALMRRDSSSSLGSSWKRSMAPS